MEQIEFFDLPEIQKAVATSTERSRKEESLNNLQLGFDFEFTIVDVPEVKRQVVSPFVTNEWGDPLPRNFEEQHEYLYRHYSLEQVVRLHSILLNKSLVTIRDSESEPAIQEILDWIFRPIPLVQIIEDSAGNRCRINVVQKIPNGWHFVCVERFLIAFQFETCCALERLNPDIIRAEVWDQFHDQYDLPPFNSSWVEPTNKSFIASTIINK